VPRRSLTPLARLAWRLELIARKPLDGLCLFSRKPTKNETEASHLGVAAEIPVGFVLIARLMVVVRNEVFALRVAPSLVVAFIELALINRKRRHAYTR